MLDFEVKKFTRVCAETEHQFQAGETFYAYLVREGGDTVRRDVCVDAWNGPPDDCIAWWKASVPDLKSKKLNWAPNDVLLHYFQETEDKPDEQDIRYILTLLLIRKRVFRLESSEQQEFGEALVVYCSQNESEYAVPVLTISSARAQEIQTMLSQLIVDAGSDGA